MDTISVAPATRTDTTEADALRLRAARGFELFESRGREIVRTGPFTYLVPGSKDGEFYAVNYKTETCDCQDYEYSGLGACKYLSSVGCLRASRRSSTAANLDALEDIARHEDRDPDERLELLEDLARARRLAGI